MATRVGFTIPNTFAGQSGNVPASQLDTDFSKLASIVTDSGTGWSNFSTDTGSANAYVITNTPPAAAYTSGMLQSFVAANTNTGASTINSDALGAITIQNALGQALSGGDIVANQLTTCVYTGSVFKILSPCASNLTGGLNGGYLNFGNQRVIFDDFMGYTGTVPTTSYFGLLPWLVGTQGANSAVSFSTNGLTSTLKAAGEIQVATGTTASGAASINGGGFFPALGPAELDFRINVGSLPTGADNFNVFFGITDINANNQNCIQFVGQFTSSAILFGQCINGGTITSTSTQALTSAAYHRYRIVINAAWSSVSFYVDGVQLGSSITTNIPTTLALYPIFQMSKTAGSNTRSAYIDQFYFSYIYTV